MLSPIAARAKLEAKLKLHLPPGLARTYVSSLRSESLVVRLVTRPKHVQSTAKDLAEFVISKLSNGPEEGGGVQALQPSIPPAQVAVPLRDQQRSIMLASASTALQAQKGLSHVEVQLKVQCSGAVAVVLQKSFALQMLGGAELQRVCTDRQDLLRVVQPHVPLDGLMAYMVRPCKKKHWRPCTAQEVLQELQIAQMVLSVGGDACKASLCTVRFVVVGGANLAHTYLVRDAGLEPIDEVAAFICKDRAEQEPNRVACAASDLRDVVAGALQGLLQLHERGFSYNRSGLEVVFCRRLEGRLQGMLIGFGGLRHHRELSPGADYKAAFNLLDDAARVLNFWSKSATYAHTHQIFVDTGCTLRHEGLRQALAVLHDVDACHARIVVQLKQQEDLRAERVRLQAEFAGKAADQRQAALENAAYVEQMRSRFKDITARRPTARRQQPEPQISANTVQTNKARREKRWREGQQTMADLRLVHGSTNMSELLLPLMGSVVVDRLELKGWLTVEQLLKAGANKAILAVPMALPDLRERLRRVITVLGKHLRIKPESVWEAVLDVEDSHDEDNESTGFGSDDGSSSPKRCRV